MTVTLVGIHGIMTELAAEEGGGAPAEHVEIPFGVAGLFEVIVREWAKPSMARVRIRVRIRVRVRVRVSVRVRVRARVRVSFHCGKAGQHGQS